MVDKYLLEAKMLSEEKNHKGAQEAMDRIVALQKEHGLMLPESFSFQYAQTALAAGAVQAAIDSANRYLSAAGREGKHYREALELLVKAERNLQEPAGTGTAKPQIEPQPQAVLPSPLQTPKTMAVRPVVDCTRWNAKEYFQEATVESVTACLEAGAAPMARDKRKNTPLHYAAGYNKNPAVIEALLKAGADPMARGGPMARDKWKDTPLHYAAKYNKNPAVIETLLKAGADPMARGGQVEYTPLHYAAGYNKNPAVIETLLKAGAEVNAGGSIENTPLHSAAGANKNPAVIEILLKAGAEVNAQQSNGKTPLHDAALHNENPAVIEVLLKAGAEVNARNEDGDTPLHYAAIRNRNPAVIELLLKAGAEVNAAHGWSKDTPLHNAGWNENPAVIEVLLAAGANLEAQNKFRYTPLHEAAEHNKNPAVIEVLLAAGANPKARTVEGKTPWDFAQDNEALKGSDAFWRLNEARFESPSEQVEQAASTVGAALNAEAFNTCVTVSNCAKEGSRVCIENRCSQPAFVRFCTTDVDGHYKPALCGSVSVRANDGFIHQGSVDHTAETYWQACPWDKAKGTKEQVCYFELPQ